MGGKMVVCNILGRYAPNPDMPPDLLAGSHPPRYASLATVRNSCQPEIYWENDEWHEIIVFERSKLRQLTVFAKLRRQTFSENM